MRRLIFSNLQGLSADAASARLALIQQLMAEEGVHVALLCEVMSSSTRLRPLAVTDAKRVSPRADVSRASEGSDR